MTTIKNSQHIARSWLSTVGPDRLLAIVDCKGCHVCEAAKKAGVVMLGFKEAPRSGLAWFTWASSPEVVKDFMAQLQAEGYFSEIVGNGGAAAPNGGTPRQHEVLQLAVEAGYFENPKRVTLAQLANRLRISESVLSRTLRRAVKNGLGGP